MKKTKNPVDANKDFDWDRLRWVEMASGIEVLYASKLFEDMRLKKAILDHALDEYSHSEILSKYTSSRRATTSIELLENAGLKEGLSYRNSNKVEVVTYLNEGERRAERFLDSLAFFDVLRREDLERIRSDESRHAEGTMKYLKTVSVAFRAYYRSKIKLMYLARRLSKGRLSQDTQRVISSLLVKVIVSLHSRGGLSFKLHRTLSLRDAIDRKRRMI